MSKTVENSLGSFFSTIIGSVPPSNYSKIKSTSLGLINFVERLEAAKKISKQEEEELVNEDYQIWIYKAALMNINNEVIADFLCRSLIAFSRGHYCTNLHIHAIKLSQNSNLYMKRIGYLYISQTMDPESDLSVLMINAILRELSSQNLIQISCGLNLIPTIYKNDYAQILGNSLSVCFSHQQSYVKRRAAIMSSIFMYQEFPIDYNCIASLNHLISDLLRDSDPAVAMSSTMTLSKIYKFSEDHLLQENMRTHLAHNSAHILNQAVIGALPSHYNTGPTHAPFVQIQMLRVFQNLVSSTWDVPESVIDSITKVLHQPWGGRDLSLYMTYIEAIKTITVLPRNDQLLKYSLKIIMGFIKSSYVDFKYLGIKSLNLIIIKIEESLSQSYLEAVLQCLYSPSISLRSKTVQLLCSMTTQINYQAICSTLLDFALQNESDDFTRNSVHCQLAKILDRLDVDIVWCAAFLSAILCRADCKQELHSSFSRAISKVQNFSQEERNNVCSNLQKLLERLLKLDPISLVQMKSASAIVNACLKSGFEFQFNLIAVLIAKCEPFCQLDEEITECLLNCGLNIDNCSPKIIAIFNCQSDNVDIYYSFRIKEMLSILQNKIISQKIKKNSLAILHNSSWIDLSLSFSDQYVIDWWNLETASNTGNSDVDGVANEKTTGFTNPFDSRCSSPTPLSGDKDSLHSTSDSFKSSGGMTSYSSSFRTEKRLNIWTSKGRLRDSSDDSASSQTEDTEPLSTGISRVEMAHEALMDEPDDGNENSISFIESHKTELTKAFLKGLGFNQ